MSKDKNDQPGDKRMFIVTAGDDKNQIWIDNRLHKVGDKVELTNAAASSMLGRTIAVYEEPKEEPKAETKASAAKETAKTEEAKGEATTGPSHTSALADMGKAAQAPKIEDIPVKTGR